MQCSLNKQSESHHAAHVWDHYLLAEKYVLLLADDFYSVGDDGE